MAANSDLRYTELVRFATGPSLFPKRNEPSGTEPVGVTDRDSWRSNESDRGIWQGLRTKANEKTMPKLKTHSGAAKRFAKTGSGKIKRHQTKMRHILTSKLPKTKRKLGKSLIVSDADHDKVARMIPYA